MKQCNLCLETKDYSLFSTAKYGKDGYRTKCKACLAKIKSENYHKKKEAGLYDSALNKHHCLKKLYGIGIEEYNKMLAAQDNKCAICKQPEDNFKRKLCVDHNHVTGVVRGLLCHHCNTAIGLLKEDVNIFKTSLEYLEYHKTKE